MLLKRDVIWNGNSGIVPGFWKDEGSTKQAEREGGKTLNKPAYGGRSDQLVQLSKRKNKEDQSVDSK
jgi:hypothetical protein